MSNRKAPSVAQRPRILALQASRGVAALLVVLCHVAGFVGEEPTLWHRYGIYLWLRGTSLGVQLFFVLSGIVIYAAHREDFDKPCTAPTFYWKRFRRIYPLYWIFLLLTLLAHRAVSATGQSNSNGPFVLLSNVVLVHLFSYQTDMVVAWTLFDEVLFYLAFSTLLLNRRIGVIILLLWMGASFCFLAPSGTYWPSIFSPNHLLFGLGIFIAWMLEKNPALPVKTIFWAGILLFTACLVVDGPFDRGIAVRLAAGVGAAGILFGAATLERQGNLTVSRWLAFLGDASYSIYLAHFMVISAVARFSYSHRRQLPLPIGVWMILLFLCGVAGGIATHLGIERPLLRTSGRRVAAQPMSL
jgi:exopolysaccharide production protein ExoZ